MKTILILFILSFNAHGIRKGESVSRGEFSSVLKLKLKKGICTGTLIHPRVVLTATHCLKRPSRSNYFVDEKKRRWRIAKVLSRSSTLHSELSLAFLIKEILDITPASIEFLETWPMAQDAVAVGFGHNGFNGKSRKKKGYLHFETLREFKGKEMWTFSPGASDQHICEGDSGGPIFIEREEAFKLVAISSFIYQEGENLKRYRSVKRRCHQANRSGMISLYPHRDWLMTNLPGFSIFFD